MQSVVLSESYGRYLQAARLAKGISLEQVAAQTRVGIRILEAIEHEDFRRLPPETFLKGFLRAFAQAVGADGGEAVRRYEAHCAIRRETESIAAEPQQLRTGAAGRFVVVVLLLALLIAGQLAAWQAMTRPPAEPPAAALFTASAPMEAAPVAGPPPGPPSVTPPADPAEASPALKLTVTALENTWLKVVTDQGTPGEHTLKPGQQLKLEARRHFNLLIGNAGAVKLALNNQPVAVPGKKGEPINLNLP
ncbi:MAG: helix-turn-helix domain-containing protein [Desulfobacterales bacterium]|nr:helix-turn-helix domain-containing protein [Desulfobacterales bacterium]